MFRDFSEDAKEQLLEYVNEVAPVTTWEKVKDCIGDMGLTVQGWLGQLNISDYVNDLDAYHKKILDKNDTSTQQIEQIFSDVTAVDAKYGAILLETVTTGTQIVKYIRDLADTIDPAGGKFTMDKMEELLGMDKADLEAEQIQLTGALTEGGQEDAASAYVEDAAGLDMTYDDFLQLTKQQQQEYISKAGSYLLSLLPSVELEAGVYEVTVPIGVDMTATYNVTVTGTVEGENEATVGLTIEQQKVVLGSVGFSGGNAGVTVEEDGIGVEGEVGNTTMSINQDVSGKAELSMKITTGDSELKFSVGGSAASTSVKYEVETAISEELKVNSSLEVEKSNNTNLPQWEPVPVEVCEYEPEPDYSPSIDGEAVVEGITAAVIVIGIYEVVKWGAAVVLAPETGGASLAVAGALP